MTQINLLIGSEFQMGNNNTNQKTIPSNVENEKIKINLATLNYGVSDCPFQYSTLPDGAIPDQQQGILQELNGKFQEIFEQEMGFPINNEFRWETGKLQKKYKVNRFSPLYYAKVGVERLNFLMNKEQFEENWMTQYKKYAKGTEEKYEKQEPEHTMKFDWICYHTIVSYVYRNNNIKEVVRNETAQKYKKFMKKQFEKVTINEDHKIQKIFKWLDNFQVDILFLQEASKQILTVIEKKNENYRVVEGRNSDSIILISWALCEKLLGKYAYSTLKFFNDSYLQHADLFFHNSNFIPELAMEEGIMKRQSMMDTTKSGRGKFIGINRLFSFPVPESEENIRQMEDYQIKKADSEMEIQEEEEVNVSSSSSDSSSSSSSDEEEKRLKFSKKNRKYLPIAIMKKFNFNGNSVVQFIGNLILLSIHLTSATKNPEKKIKQKEDFVETVNKLQELFPDHVIIAGGAFNQNLSKSQLPSSDIFPRVHSKFDENLFTVHKKRSYLQGQISKANVEVKEAFDYLISTKTIENGKIITISNQQVNNNFPLIPNESHPYDHYLVTGHLEIEKTRNFNLRKTK